MPGESLHAAAPSQCLVIITIIIINIIIILLIITIIIRLEIRIFRHPFSKYPTVRWKWQVRASIGTAKRDIGVCANTDRVFFPARCVCLTMYTSKWLFKWTKWWATMDIVGCSLFGPRYLRSALNVQFHAPPSELSSHALCVSSRSSPFAVSHHQHHRHHPHHHHHSTWNSDFSTSIFQVPNGAMKVTGSSIHRYRKKRHWSLCYNTDRVFFFPARCVCLTMYTSKWLFKWTKWWATMDIVGCSLFGSRYLRSALNVQFHAPPKWTLVTCLVRLFTQ